MEEDKTDMKKILRIWLRHPISVTGIVIALGLAIQTRSFYPVIILIIPLCFVYVLWELVFLYCHLEKDFWRTLTRNIIEQKEMEKDH